VRARVQGAQANLAAALATLDEAADLAPRLAIPWIAPLLDAYRAQLWLAKGRLDAAADWVARAGETAAMPQMALSSQFTIYAYEHLAMVPIQVLIAQGWATVDPAPLRAAIDLALQQQERAEAARIPWQRIKALALQALAWAALGEGERAGRLLQQAVETAAPERYVRLFADEGAPMAALLAALPVGDAGGDGSASYVQVLLAACRG
jgi:tetratricopeptide (TPR) repeat protein